MISSRPFLIFVAAAVIRTLHHHHHHCSTLHSNTIIVLFLLISHPVSHHLVIWWPIFFVRGWVDPAFRLSLTAMVEFFQLLMENLALQSSIWHLYIPHHKTVVISHLDLWSHSNPTWLLRNFLAQKESPSRRRSNGFSSFIIMQRETAYLWGPMILASDRLSLSQNSESDMVKKERERGWLAEENLIKRAAWLRGEG